MSSPHEAAFSPAVLALVVDMIAPVVQDLVASLGESPEAWRGAINLHDVLREGATLLSNELENNPIPATPERKLALVATVLTGVLIMFDSHDMTKAMRENLG